MVPRLAAVLMLGVAGVVAPGAASGAQAGSTGGPVKAKANGNGMTVTLIARPGHPRKGALVHFVATASAAEATGALGRTLTYGDGKSAPPIAMPEFCMAPPGRPATATWRFTHRYSAPGRYTVKFGAFVNCGGGRATVSVTVKVRA